MLRAAQLVSSWLRLGLASEATLSVVGLVLGTGAKVGVSRGSPQGLLSPTHGSSGCLLYSFRAGMW